MPRVLPTCERSGENLESEMSKTALSLDHLIFSVIPTEGCQIKEKK